MISPPAVEPSVFARYAKAFGAVAVTVLVFVLSVITDGITAPEWVLIGQTAVTAVGVAVVPNLAAGVATVAKTVVAALIAGLGVLAVVIIGGLTPAEVMEVVVATLGAVGVTAIPNALPVSPLPPAV